MSESEGMEYYGLSVEDYADLRHSTKDGVGVGGDEHSVDDDAERDGTDLWYEGWRYYIAPRLSHEALEAIRSALTIDDPRLMQSKTCLPIYPPEADVRCACLIGFGGWQGDKIKKTKQLQQYFERITGTEVVSENCISYDPEGEPNPTPPQVRAWIHWFDETPREEMRQAMLVEVHREFNRRAQANLPVVIVGGDE